MTNIISLAGNETQKDQLKLLKENAEAVDRFVSSIEAYSTSYNIGTNSEKAIYDGLMADFNNKVAGANSEEKYNADLILKYAWILKTLSYKVNANIDDLVKRDQKNVEKFVQDEFTPYPVGTKTIGTINKNSSQDVSIHLYRSTKICHDRKAQTRITR